MKKLLSVVLAISMILSCCLLLSSCDKISEKKVNKDPATVLMTASQDTLGQFFTDDADIADIIADAMQKGSVSLTVEADALKDSIGLGKIAWTQYVDAATKKGVVDLSVNFADEDLAAKIFVDKNGLILNSNALLGSETSYAFYPQTLADGFASSPLASMMGVEGEALTEMTEALQMYADAYKKAFDPVDKKEAADQLNDMLALLNQQISSKTMADGDKEIDCVVMTYTLSNETMRAFLEKAMSDSASVGGEDVQEQMDELFATMDQEVALDGTIEVYLNKKTGLIAKEVVDLSVDSKSEYGEDADIQATMTYGASAITMEFAATLDGEDVSAKIVLDKTAEGDSVVYRVVVSGKSAGVSIDALTATLTYNKADKSYAIEAKLSETLGGETIKLVGNLTTDKKEATVSISSVKVGDITVEFEELSVAFRADVEMPAAPAEVKDVVTMTEEDIATFIEDLQNGMLGQLIFGMMPY